MQGDVDVACGDGGARLLREASRGARLIDIDRRHLMPGAEQSGFQRRLAVAPREIEKARGGGVAGKEQRQDRRGVAFDDIRPPAVRRRDLRCLGADDVERRGLEGVGGCARAFDPLGARDENGVVTSLGHWRPRRYDLQNWRYDRRHSEGGELFRAA